MSPADFKLDSQLRGVRLPDGLLDRLMALPLAGDEGIDGLVCDVAVPAGLVERLQAIPLAYDDGLDEALRNVPTPGDLMASFRRRLRRRAARSEGRHIARRDERRSMGRAMRISRFAMAASMILAVTLSLGSLMWLSFYLNGTPSQVAKEDGIPIPPKSPTPAEKRLETSWSMLAEDAPRPATGALQPGDYKRDIEFTDIEPSPEQASGQAARDRLASAQMPSGANPLAVSVDQHLSTTYSWDDLPELPWRVPNLVPHGLDWPVVPGANREVLIKYGFHPFVSPSADPHLQTCPVPLAVEPSSYELTRRYLERNELPPADRVRTEEFLAAVDYNFPKPTNQALGLIVAGGPSPFHGEACLVQVGVQARALDLAKHPPLHLVLVIDTSTSMRWGSRIEIVRRALRDLPGITGGDDRLSLVTFNQAAHVLVENANRDALPQFAAAADSLTAEGATNLVDGLREAYGVARQTLGSGRPAVRVVLLTDGLLDLEPASMETIAQQAAQAAGQNIPLDVIDLGQQKEPDPQVAALCQAGRGKAHRAVSANQVRWALREIVTGRSQVVARAARLKVKFNPKAVLEYRLLGHESGELDGLLPGPLEADFCEGQAATALFEVRLAPKGGDNLATVELTWNTPDGEKATGGKAAQKADKKIERKNVAATLIGEAPSLQEATVVAYTAEVLRHSPFIFYRGSGLSTPAALFRAVEISSQIDSQLQSLSSFDEFMDLVRQEMRAHPAKHPAKD